MCSLWGRLGGEKTGTPVSVSERDTIFLARFVENQHFVLMFLLNLGPMSHKVIQEILPQLQLLVRIKMG